MALDLDVVRELAALGLAPEEVLAELGAFGEDPAALPGFSREWRLGRAMGRARMKRAAYERALAGNVKAIALLLEWLDDSPPEEKEQERRRSRPAGREDAGYDGGDEDDGDEPPDDIFDEGAIVVRSIEHPNGSIERYALRDPAAPSPRHPDEFPLKALPAGSAVQEQMRRRNQAIRDAAGITEPMVSGGPLPIPTLPASGQAPPFSDPLPPTQVGSGG
jgi:hypothetical protein